jgi:hypothetical protein
MCCYLVTVAKRRAKRVHSEPRRGTNEESLSTEVPHPINLQSRGLTQIIVFYNHSHVIGMGNDTNWAIP